MKLEDIFLSKLTAYREAANQGAAGLTAVLWIIKNRKLKNDSSYYKECTKRWQFSSVSISSFGTENTKVEPLVTAAEVLRLKNKVNNGNMFIIVLSKYPDVETDPVYLELDDLLTGVDSGGIVDPTGGATNYYAAGTIVPEWAKDGSFIKTVQIGAHIFFKNA